MMIEITDIDDIDKHLVYGEVMLLKFDNKESKYNEYFHSLELKVISITDEEIIDFYDIDVLPTIYIYKNKNLIDTIEGFHTKTELLKKILQIVS